MSVPENEIAVALSFAMPHARRAYSRPVCRRAAVGAVAVLLMFAGSAPKACADSSSNEQNSSGDLASLSLEQLGNVEVTSVSKAPQEVMQTPAAVFVISQEDIRRSGATSIPEALRLAPGVEVAQIDGNHWSVAIRGFAGQFSKSLLVLVDGRSIYTPLFEGVYWDLPYVMIEDVERIEVIRGPGGTIWGSNAVNGVINIITKSATSTHGILATTGSGTVDQGTGAFRYGGTVGDKFDYRIYGMGGLRGQEFHPDDDGFDHWRMGQYGFRTDWKSGEKDTFTVQGDNYRGMSEESIYIPSFEPPAETPTQGWDFVSGGDILARWIHKTGEDSDVQLQTYFDRTNRQNFELGETRDTFDVDFVQHQRTHGEQKLTWGLGVRISPSNFIQTVDGISFLPNKQTDSIYSGFVQYEIPIIANKLTLTAGTKLEHNNFSGFEYQPSLRILWTPTPRHSFWAAATRAVRTPSRLDQDVLFDIFDELYTPPPSGSGPPPAPIPVYFQIEGDPTLKAEQMIGSEFGYRTQLGNRAFIDLATFYNIYNDLQGYGPAGLAESGPDLFFVLPYANVIEGHTVGGEIAPNWKITRWWQLRGSYSYLHMSLRDNPGFTDVGGLLASYLGSTPGSMVDVQSLFDLPLHFELDEMFRYSAKLPAQLVPSYSTADVRLGWHGWRGLELSLLGQNLLQPSHPEFGGDPGPLVGIKRSVYGKITWNFQDR